MLIYICTHNKIQGRDNFMKKKAFVTTLMVALAGAALVSCGKKTYEIALVTDVGTINDKSFNQGAWEGVQAYAKEHNISYKYYQPEEKSTEKYVESAEVAIKNGAKVVVTPGFLFENAVWTLQTAHPDVKFILLDGAPHNVTDWDTMATVDGSEADFTVKENVYSIFYAEQEAGFLAGFAAVKEGFRKLGYMGGMSVPAVVRFGTGYIEGAMAAADELGLEDGEVTMKFTYLNSFLPEEQHQTLSTSWFGTGTEVIFAAAGGAGSSVMAAAEKLENKWVIGVDVDQSSESRTVLTSAVKGLKSSVIQTLEKIYANEKGGESVTLDAKVDGVGLPNDFSRFKNFTQEDYEAVFAKVKDGTYAPVFHPNGDGLDYKAIGGTRVPVDYIE